jgi:drug/metabolite transporter (DMT)-like permease
MSQDRAIPSPLKANLLVFAAAFAWSSGFPAGDILMGSWDLLTLLVLRLVPGTLILLILWRMIEGEIVTDAATWFAGIIVGGIGFGLGTTLLLYGQKQSSPVTPAVAAAMMPVAGALLEIVLDKRRVSATLAVGLACAVVGGLIAAGVTWGEYEMGLGFLWCIVAICLYTWATRETNRRFSDLSSFSQTVITLVGAAIFVTIVWVFANIAYPEQRQYGSFGNEALLVIFIFSVLSVSISQPCWIAGARGLGVAVASFHLNAVPFYVMAVVVFLGEGSFELSRLFGVLIVAVGVYLAQRPGKDATVLPKIERA